MSAQLAISFDAPPDPLVLAEGALAVATAAYHRTLEACDSLHRHTWLRAARPCCDLRHRAWVEWCLAYKELVTARVLRDLAEARASSGVA